MENLNKKFLGGYCENLEGACKMTAIFKYDSENDTLKYISLAKDSPSGISNLGYIELNEFFLDIDKRDLLNRVSISAILSKGLYLNGEYESENIPIYFGNSIGSSNIIFENYIKVTDSEDVYYYSTFTFNIYTNKSNLSKDFRKVDSTVKVKITDELYSEISKRESKKIMNDLLKLSKCYSTLVKKYKVNNQSDVVSWIG